MDDRDLDKTIDEIDHFNGKLLALRYKENNINDNRGDNSNIISGVKENNNITIPSLLLMLSSVILFNALRK